MTKINLKNIDPEMMRNTEAMGRVQLSSLPAEVTGTMSAVEGAANMAFRAFDRSVELLEEAKGQGDAAAITAAEEAAIGLAWTWRQMELDRVALLLHRGLSLQGRSVLSAFA